VTLIAVGPSAREYGIDKPKSRASFRQVELADALADTYATDAHLVTYVDRSRVDGRQHRWTKGALECPLVDPSLLVVESVFVDVDNPNHAAWTDSLMADAVSSFERLPLPCGVYFTAHGYRLVQPLASPVPVLRAERVIREVLLHLDAAGFPVDWSAKDWTRHFRLPNIRRSGKPYRSPFVDLSRMRPVDIVVPVVEDAIDVPGPRTKKRAVATPQTWTTSLAEHWQRRAKVIGEAIRGTVSAEYHQMYLAIGGALLSKGTPPEHVPELVRLIATHAGSSKPAHHGKSARDTVARYAAQQAVTGLSFLNRYHPAVADAVHDALEDAVERPPMSAPAPHLSATTAALEEAIRSAGDGLTVVRAECGLGKTQAAMKVAGERARKLHLAVVASQRAPLQSKTAISVDKNELAIQVAKDLAKSGVSVRRIFGPLSMKSDDGAFACRLHDRATHIVNGGQSLQWEFCLGREKSKCEHYDGCTARDGEEVYGEGSPRVTVGTHALLSRLDAAAGATGLLVIDEPPPLVESLVITPDDIEVALRRVHDFVRAFAVEITPLLLAVRDWDDAGVSFAELTSTLDIGAVEERPPLRATSALLARVSLDAAREIGTASRVMLTLARACHQPSLVSVRLEDEPRRIVVTSTKGDLTDALRREGSVVAMDANADLHMPAFAKVVGYEPVLHSFAASDGAPVERTHLRSSASSRRAWISHGRLVFDTGVVHALREVIEWANATRIDEIRPIRLGIITMRVVELAIEAALRPNDETVDAAWKAAKQSAEALATARAELGPVLSAFRGEISTAHYGATRGLNRMADVDCLATVGDPWPSVPDVQTESAFLGVDWEERLRRQCEAELEQAHGRLRAVHRKRPARALHVGRVSPGGSAWATSAVLRSRMAGGRPKAAATMPVDELRKAVETLGGARSAGRLLGCAARTIDRYLAGRGVPPAVASRLRELAIGVSVATDRSLSLAKAATETPIREEVFNRGFGRGGASPQPGKGDHAAE